MLQFKDFINEAARNPNNPYVRKLSKPAQKVFHTVMYNILKKGIDPYSMSAHRAEVDLVGSRLNAKDLAAVKMAVQNEGTEEIDEISPAARRKRNQASLLKTMAKYRAADKAGIPADQVNQRRNAPTRKKSR